MKKIFNYTASLVGALSSGAIMLILLYVLLFSINESNGKSIAGKTKTFTGKITGITCHEGTYDINFSVEGQRKSYYINRGMEKGLNCEDLQKQLMNKKVEISHVAFFNNASSGHINQLTCDGRVLYTELK